MSHSRAQVRKNTPRLRIVRSVSNALHLPRTAERILESLSRAGKYMPVRELVKRVRMSERSVRKHLSLLVRRGILQRRAVSRGPKKIAYEYSLRPARELLEVAREDFARTLKRLELVVRRISGERTSPKNVSSLRN
jgi:predicted DNA-binding transcriptional regulator